MVRPQLVWSNLITKTYSQLQQLQSRSNPHLRSPLLLLLKFYNLYSRHRKRLAQTLLPHQNSKSRRARSYSKRRIVRRSPKWWGRRRGISGSARCDFRKSKQVEYAKLMIRPRVERGVIAPLSLISHWLAIVTDLHQAVSRESYTQAVTLPPAKGLTILVRLSTAAR